MQHFRIEIGAPDQHLQASAVATSADGSVTAAILSNDTQGPDASAIVTEYLEAGRRIDPQGRTDRGSYLILDRKSGRTCVVTSPLMLQQIYWSARDGRLRLASTPDALVPGHGSASPPPDALFHYVYFHSLPGPSSIYPDLKRLDAGTLLQWDGKAASVQRYWQPKFVDTATLSPADAAAQLHELLDQAVRRRASDGKRFGTFLSGGLDSSTVAGFAARVQPGVPTISMGFDASGYDEMEYAKLAARHFGTRALEYYVTPEDVAATLPQVAAAFAEPFGNSSAAAAYHCARIAREHGIELLLAGDGGDEIFGGNERYAKQLVFERYAAVPRPVRTALLEPMVAAAARLTRAFPIGKAHSYIEQASVPLPDRLQSYNFLHRHDPAEVFTADCLAGIDREQPLRLLRAEYAVPITRSAINRMLFLDWKFTLHDNDLVKVNTMCDLAGVSVAYPLLDQSLVDFSLRIPGDWKVRRGELRWFYKRAMVGFLPREILEKKKHGFGLPFGVWTRTHAGLQQLATDCLGSLGSRGYFRQEFLREVQRMHAEGHAAYYGELVWILMVLELWLRRHMPNARL